MVYRLGRIRRECIAAAFHCVLLKTLLDTISSIHLGGVHLLKASILLVYINIVWNVGMGRGMVCVCGEVHMKGQ